MGMAEKKRRHADLAEKAYRQALEIDPNNVVALNNLAWIAMMNPERAGEAVGYAKKAARRGAQDGTSAGYAGMGVPREWGEWRLAGQFSEPDAETLRKALATPFPEMNDAKTRLAANKGVS
jgi:Tfp pilus assembly protein PilF